MPPLRLTTLVDCGCTTTVYGDGSGVEINYCPLHAAAPRLLDAGEELLRVLDSTEYGNLEAVAALRAAIAAAGAQP